MQHVPNTTVLLQDPQQMCHLDNAKQGASHLPIYFQLYFLQGKRAAPSICIVIVFASLCCCSRGSLWNMIEHNCNYVEMGHVGWEVLERKRKMARARVPFPRCNLVPDFFHFFQLGFYSAASNQTEKQTVYAGKAGECRAFNLFNTYWPHLHLWLASL